MVGSAFVRYALLLMLLLGVAVIWSPAAASVKYTFVVTGQPTGDFFKPLSAELTISDAAVSAGTASKGQIESVVFGGGPAMQEENQLTLTYLHDDFGDLTLTLSADRKTITDISATLKSTNSPIDSWVFHYQKPAHPTLEIHEFVGSVKKDSVTLETTILPVPPTHHFASFTGQWRRTRSCWFFSRILYKPSPILPICWIDLIVLSVATLVVSGALFWYSRTKRRR